jgi:hypothetical protein
MAVASNSPSYQLPTSLSHMLQPPSHLIRCCIFTAIETVLSNNKLGNVCIEWQFWHVCSVLASRFLIWKCSLINSWSCYRWLFVLSRHELWPFENGVKYVKEHYLISKEHQVENHCCRRISEPLDTIWISNRSSNNYKVIFNIGYSELQFNKKTHLCQHF